MKSHFDLEKAIATWRQFHERRRMLLPQDLNELECHLRDHVAERVGAGVREEAAFEEALHAVGDVGEAEPEYKKVYWGKLQRRHAIINEFIWRGTMLRNYLTVALRNLGQRKGYTAIIVTSLGVAVTASLLILSYIQHERSFDTFHDEVEHLYRVGEAEEGDPVYFRTRPRLLPAVLEHIPGVASGTRTIEANPWVSYNNQRFEESGYYVDDTFFEVFSFPLVAGDQRTVWEPPNAVVMSETLARKYFAQDDPLGKMVIIDFQEHVVTGVMADFPAASTLQADMLLPIAPLPDRWGDSWNWGNTFMPMYLRLHGEASPDEVADQMASLLQRNIDDEEATSFLLFPMRDFHLQAAGELWTPGVSGAQKRLLVLLIIGIAILCIAAINATNLATAQALTRAREIGMRKVLGAHRGQLITQFFGEAALLSFAAMLLGSGLAWVVHPFFNEVWGTTMTLDLRQPSVLLLILGIGGVVGLLAGSYPAFYLSRLRPVASLKGRLQHSRFSVRARNGLVVAQFALSVMLIASTLVMHKQITFMKQQELHFDDEGVVVMPLAVDDFEDEAVASSRIETLKSELLRHPAIQAVSSARAFPGISRDWATDFDVEGGAEPVHSRWTSVDDAYFPLFGIDLVEGRNFDGTREAEVWRTAIINETARAAFGWETAVGKHIDWGGDEPFEVIGVVDDFHFASLEEAIYPMVHFFGGTTASNYDYLAIKLGPGDVTPALAYIEEQLDVLDPARTFDYFFADAYFNQHYEEMERQSVMLGFFAGLAILIACLGLFGLASYITTQRRKEIGIRKVLGASASDVLVLLTKNIALLVLVAFVIGAPLTFLIMERWLADFAYRMELGSGLFLLAGGMALLIALGTVGYQSLRAALADPVKTIRYE